MAKAKYPKIKVKLWEAAPDYIEMMVVVSDAMRAAAVSHEDIRKFNFEMLEADTPVETMNCVQKWVSCPDHIDVLDMLIRAEYADAENKIEEQQDDDFDVSEFLR